MTDTRTDVTGIVPAPRQAVGGETVSKETLASISTADRVESRLGTLEFDDGAPSEATATKLQDDLDFLHGVEAFLGAFPAASLEALRQGFLSIGVEDNSVLLFSELMDSASLFLTANCDTVYFISFVDLTDGPMVVDVPPLGAPSGILGTIDDMQFRWVTDFGLPGPDRTEGGRYLLVGPGYAGPLPDSGFHVSHVRTTRAVVLGRAFMVDNDPGQPVEAIRNGFCISPYAPGVQGTAVATFLAGRGHSGLRRRRRRPASSRAPACRSTRSRRTTSPSGRPSTARCSGNRPWPVSRS